MLPIWARYRDGGMLQPPSPPSPADTPVIKRVVALPLETISLTASGIVVNGSVLSLPAALSNAAIFSPDNLPVPATASAVKFPYTVPPNQYFMIGDNWTNSFDSRHYGAVLVTNILGKVLNK